jgi:hypothetical protein
MKQFIKLMKQFVKFWNDHIALPIETVLFLAAVFAYILKVDDTDDNQAKEPPHTNITTATPSPITFTVDLSLDVIFIILNILVMTPGKMSEDVSNGWKYGVNLMACLAFIVASIANISLVAQEDSLDQFHKTYYIGPSLYMGGSLPLVGSAIHQACLNRGETKCLENIMQVIKPLLITLMNASNLVVGTFLKETDLNNKVLCGLFIGLLAANSALLVSSKARKSDTSLLSSLWKGPLIKNSHDITTTNAIVSVQVAPFPT